MADKKIDQLQWEVSDIQKSLNELKSAALSEADKKTKTEEIKNKAETTKQAIQSKIDQLKDKKGADSISEREKAETLLKTLNDIITLQLSIWEKSWDKTKDGAISTWEKPTETTASTWETEWEKKWFFWKTWARIWDQWSDVTSWDKWKEEPWKNILRAVGFWVTWYALYKWVKKLWNWAFWKKKGNENEWGSKPESESSSKEDNTKEEKSFWDKPVWKFIKWAGAVLWVWTWVYYVAHGLYTKNRWLKDLWDWEKGKKLEFDAALEYCKWAIANQDNKEGMSYWMDLKYHEDTSEIEAYWEKIKIDKDKRKIPWVWLGDVEFKKYEHMINTAIVIAYLKKNYSWKCANNNPFYLTGNWQWDINVNTWNSSEEAVDWTGNWGRIVWVTAGWIAWIVSWIFWWLQVWAAVTTIWCAWWYMIGSAYDHNNIMNDHMPELDNEFWRKSLWAYLNNMNCWESKNQTADDIKESPIKQEVIDCMQSIQDTSPELESRWARRKLDAIQDPNDEKKYIIKAYGRDFSAEVTWTQWNRKIRILWISWWTPAIKTDMEKSWLSWLELPLKEWIYMSSFIWFLLDNYPNKWNDYPRFEYTRKALKFLRVWRGSSIGWWDTWIYFSDPWLDTRVLSKDKFKERMPTLFEEENRKIFLNFLNDWITGENNISIWKK